MAIFWNTVTMIGSVFLLMIVCYAQTLLQPLEPVSISFQLSDFLVGSVGYFKTSLEFAIIVGLLFCTFSTSKMKSISVSFTSIGNTMGTILVLIAYFVFRNSSVFLLVLISLGIFFFFQWPGLALSILRPKTTILSQ